MEANDITIERLSPDDWPAYRAIRLEALQDSPQAFGASYADAVAKPDAFWRHRLEQAQAQVDNWLLFARKEGQLVGIIGAFTSNDPHIAEIISVYVSPTARGCGIAQRLMTAILDELARSAAVEKASWSSMSSNCRPSPSTSVPASRSRARKRRSWAMAFGTRNS